MKIKVKKGEKITLELRRKKPIVQSPKSKVQSQPAALNGIIRPRREQEYSARRRKNDLLINFYDLGQVKNESGDFVDLDFSIQPELTISAHAISEVASMTDADALSLNSKLFEIPVAEWKDNYRKLSFEEAEKYGIDLYLGSAGEEFEAAKYYPVARNNSRGKIYNEDEPVTSSKWTSAGLKIIKPAMPGFEVYAALGFNSFRASDTAQVKITTEADPEAAPRILTLDSAADIFLVPHLFLTYVRAVETENSPFPADYLDFSFRPLPRSFFLDYVPFGAQNPGKTLLNSNQSDQIGFLEEITQIKAEAFSNALENVSGVRLFRKTDGETSGFSSPNAFAFHSENYLECADNYNVFGTSLGGQVRAAPGSLLAVVKKGAQNYFLWATEDFETDGRRFSAFFSQ